MARPRFHHLPIEQQNAILDGALHEFAAHGFRDASLNRIIEVAGVSKGSLYYYFDGKEDLYAHVIRTQLENLFQRAAPLTVPDTKDPDEYWTTLERHYLALIRMLMTAPPAAALLRDWLTAPAAPALRGTQREAEKILSPWLVRAASAGQEIGAVRTDLPMDLLLAVVLGIGQATDTWLITQSLDGAELPNTVHVVIDVIRRAVSPL